MGGTGTVRIEQFLSESGGKFQSLQATLTGKVQWMTQLWVFNICLLKAGYATLYAEILPWTEVHKAHINKTFSEIWRHQKGFPAEERYWPSSPLSPRITKSFPGALWGDEHLSHSVLCISVSTLFYYVVFRVIVQLSLKGPTTEEIFTVPIFQRTRDAFNRNLDLEVWSYLIESTMSRALTLWMQIPEISFLGRADIAGFIPPLLTPK